MVMATGWLEVITVPEGVSIVPLRGRSPSIGRPWQRQGHLIWDASGMSTHQVGRGHDGDNGVGFSGHDIESRC